MNVSTTITLALDSLEIREAVVARPRGCAAVAKWPKVEGRSAADRPPQAEINHRKPPTEIIIHNTNYSDDTKNTDDNWYLGLGWKSAMVLIGVGIRILMSAMVLIGVEKCNRPDWG